MKFWLLTLLGLGLVLALGARPALAVPDCADPDGDTYVVCSGCNAGSNTCGDCAEGNGSVFPGAPEKCNDVDDDCDVSIDEDFDKGDSCSVPFVNAFGTCLTAGTKVCKADETGTECQANGPLNVAEEEGPYLDQSCYDTVDNDCDGFKDTADIAVGGCNGPEVCNGQDEDNDGNIDETFTDLGDACSEGVGICQKNGTRICKADGSDTQCSVSPGGPVVEGPAGGVKCADALDNDCDGTTDLADASCQTAEVCDNADNDGDGEVDETFTDLGDACSAGQGACAANGTKVCTANKTATVCSAAAGLAGTEGPTGPTCSDGIDNDCDGTMDAGDTNCNSASMAVQCSFAFTNGRPGDDCTGKHFAVYSGSGGGPGTTTTAELLGLDATGKVIKALPGIISGDEVHVASRVDPSDWKIRTVLKPRRHDVFAPVAMLRVTRTDGVATATAYCSAIPFLDVQQPSGGVVTEGDGGVINVLAAIPRVNPDTLFIKVDGVDILDELGIDPVTAFPGTATGGVVQIGGAPVTVSDIVVDSGGINVLSSNSVKFSLSGLGCGGHVIVVDAEKAADVYVKPPTLDCLVDDVRDTGTASVFGITIDSPTPGEETAAIPTPVTGEVCGGLPILAANVNGKALPVLGQVNTPGDGEDSGDKVVLDINTSLEQTDLVGDIAHTVTELGTFDPGSNKLEASATDNQGNMAFKSFLFAVGDVASAGGSASIGELKAAVQDEVEGSLQNALAATNIPNAFVLGVEPAAINTFFAETCVQATTDAETKVREALLAKDFPKKEVNGGISCNPDVDFSITSVDFAGDLSCNVTLGNGSLTVHVGIPTVNLGVSAYGKCRTEDPVFGVCISETIVDIDGTAALTGMAVDFPVTEAQFTAGGDSVGTFVPGMATMQVTNDDSEVNCLAGFIADVISGFVNFLITVFTFGQADANFDLTPSFDGVFKEVDLTEKLGIKEFTIKIKEIKPNEQEVADKDKLLTVNLDNVKIRPEGLTASLNAAFSATSNDPEVLDAPGANLTPTDAPMPHQAGTDNTYFVMADDAMNQLFASMTTQGEIKTICLPTTNDACTGAGVPNSCCTGAGAGTCVGKTIGDLLPANCGGLLLPRLIGICTGVKEMDCEALGLPVAQGACHGIRGDSCETIPVGILPANAEAEKEACRDNPSPNIFADMPLLFCGRADVPPNLLVQDNPATGTLVESTLRLNDLLVGMVIDRTGNHMLDGQLNAVPPCGGDGVDTTGDCKVLATCLDINFNTTLGLDTTGGKLKIKPTINSVDFPPRDPGVVCEGATPIGNSIAETLTESANSNPVDEVKKDVDQFTPPIESQGLDLGGVVLFDAPRLIAIENGGNPDLDDYLGVTGNIVPLP
jgi:hypothetical protein